MAVQRLGRQHPECSSENITDKTLYIKDWFNVSNQTYHELAMVNKKLPLSSALTKRARELDAKSIICATPGENIAVQESLKECLKKQRDFSATKPLYS